MDRSATVRRVGSMVVVRIAGLGSVSMTPRQAKRLARDVVTVAAAIDPLFDALDTPQCLELARAAGQGMSGPCEICGQGPCRERQ
jgi:hypothetical protein